LKIHLKRTTSCRTLWDVIGRVRGSEFQTMGRGGNHRDAWVYGAVDPNSGRPAMLRRCMVSATCLKSGWKPKRTLIFGVGTAKKKPDRFYRMGRATRAELENGAAYFNMDVAVSGSRFWGVGGAESETVSA